MEKKDLLMFPVSRFEWDRISSLHVSSVCSISMPFQNLRLEAGIFEITHRMLNPVDNTRASYYQQKAMVKARITEISWASRENWIIQRSMGAHCE